MTSCHELRLKVAAYADDELGVDGAIEVETHLDECGTCRRAVGRQRHLARALRELHPLDEPPPGFAARVRFATLGPTVVPRRAVAAGSVILALGCGLGWLATTTWRAPAHDASVTRAAISADRAADRSLDTAPHVTAAAMLHRRADARALPLDLATADTDAVNAWLRVRLPFAASIGAPGSPAITIEGAAVVSLADHPAGLVRYRMNGRAISLFLLAAPAWGDDAVPVHVGAMDFRIFQRRGLDLVGWSHAALSYLLVSEDGLRTGDACAACHGDDTRRSIADFVAAVAGRAADT